MTSELQIKKQKPRVIAEIAIRDVTPPTDQNNMEKQIEWICECLGLAQGENDLAAQIFKELLKATKDQEGVSTREIMEKEHVTQGAIVYHLNIFIQSGVVRKQGKYYFLRSTSLDRTMEELENDMLRQMRRMRELAKLIDKEIEGV
ncbi:MAG: hypothetical protein AABX38_05420 [Candidatus Micrarchaeota archaeon]